MLGFPIRTSSDHSSVDSSPRLIAASYVLHRLLVPRHPPCALKNLATKMLASTVQFSNNNPNPHPHATANTGQQPAVQTASAGPRKKHTTKEPHGSPLCPSSQDPTAYLRSTHPPPARSNSPQQRNGPHSEEADHVVLDTDDKRSNRTSQCSTHELPPQNDRLRNGPEPDMTREHSRPGPVAP